MRHQSKEDDEEEDPLRQDDVTNAPRSGSRDAPQAYDEVCCPMPSARQDRVVDDACESCGYCCCSSVLVFGALVLLLLVGSAMFSGANLALRRVPTLQDAVERIECLKDEDCDWCALPTHLWAEVPATKLAIVAPNGFDADVMVGALQQATRISAGSHDCVGGGGKLDSTCTSPLFGHHVSAMKSHTIKQIRDVVGYEDPRSTLVVLITRDPREAAVVAVQTTGFDVFLASYTPAVVKHLEFAMLVKNDTTRYRVVPHASFHKLGNVVEDLLNATASLHVPSPRRYKRCVSSHATFFPNWRWLFKPKTLQKFCEDLRSVWDERAWGACVVF